MGNMGGLEEGGEAKVILIEGWVEKEGMKRELWRRFFERARMG